MDTPNVQPEQPVSESRPWALIALELRAIAADIEEHLLDQPAPSAFSLAIQPRNADGHGVNTVKNRAETAAAVDAVAMALLNKPSRDQRMHDGTFHRSAGGNRGLVNVATYTSIADPDAVDPEEELARLRAENEKLRAAAGLDHSRADDEQDPQSVGGRVPPHFESGTCKCPTGDCEHS